MRSLILLLVLCLVFSAGLYAQTDTTGTDKDTMNVENWEDWEDWEDWDDFDFKVTEEFKGAPTIYLSYGFGTMSHTNIGNQFSEPNSWELKLGNTYQRDFKEEYDLLKYRQNFLFLSNLTTEMNSGTDKMLSESWKFGAGRSTGYGYKLGSAAIVPYHSNSLTWTRLDVTDPVRTDISNQDFSSDSAVIVRYDEAYRFGNTFEAGIKLQVIPNLSLEPSYERTVVYERHLFWKWSGSMLIEVVAQGLLDEFIEEIIDRSPYAGPVVNFLLKNALAYGMYELREEKMNWPFPSAPGLMYDQFKVGVTFTF